MCLAARERIIPWGAFRLLEIAHLHDRTKPGISFDSPPELPAPRLVLGRTGTLEEFYSSLLALVRGPATPKKFLGDPYFRNCWIEHRFPKYAFAVAT